MSSIDKGNKCSYNDFIALEALYFNSISYDVADWVASLGCSDTYGDGKIMKCEVGQAVYIVENNHVVREVTIVSQKGDFYVVRFENGKGGIRLKEHRIFLSRETAEESIPQKEKKIGYRSPYDI